MNKEEFLNLEHGMLLYNVNTGDVYQITTGVNKALFKDDVVNGEAVAEIKLRNINNGAEDSLSWVELDLTYEHLLAAYEKITDPHIKAYFTYLGMSVNNVANGVNQVMQKFKNIGGGFKL